jgi:hypothetical protein
MHIADSGSFVNYYSSILYMSSAGQPLKAQQNGPLLYA